MTGKFFALEGLECSGKTTLFNALKNKLKDTDTEFIEEAARRFSELSPEIYKDKEAMEIAYLTDNSITVHKVNQLIGKNINVIMDRSWICQLVYAQTRKLLSSNYNFNPKYVEKQGEILKSLYPSVFENTVVVYLDLPIQTILKRGAKSNGHHHREEEFNLKWLKTAKSLYEKRLEIAKREGIKVEFIKSDKSAESVLEQFYEIFKKYVLIEV